MSGARVAAATLAAVLAAAPLHASSSPPLPYRLAVEVRWGAGGGPEAFRDDVARALADAFTGRCYAAASAGADDPSAPADLHLAVSLSALKEQLRFLDSISTSLAPGDPAKELRRTALFDVNVDGALTTAGAAPVQAKHFVVSVSRQPTMLGEDPQITARTFAVERIVDELGKAMCKGQDKLDKKIKAALTQPAR
ncbi:MAG TPA: hypothetical protein VFV19_15030 [Candidatus Polarisedimenticolaceae bacterium]|nr:hypothetical protein [Candidatus Polarisedimenticolaceae bacterium]